MINRRLPPHLRLWLPLILGLAFGVRVALAIMHPFWHPDATGSPFTHPDSADYHALAVALVHHEPYQVGGLVAHRMPGYPLFLAAIYAVSGASVVAALVFQAILGAAIVLLTYLLANRISRSAGLIAATLIAFDPLTIGFSAALLSETPFTFFLMLSLWLSVKMVEPSFVHPPPGSPAARTTRGILATWMGLGLLWAICVYLRASALWLTVPLAAAILFFQQPFTRQTLARNLAGAGLAFLILLTALMPWLSRNYALFHSHFFRLTTLEGISLYEAVYPEADGGPRQDKIQLPPDMQAMNEAQRNDEWSRRAWQYIRSDPVRIARLALVKFARTWSPTFNASEMQSRSVQQVMAAWYVPLYILGLIGLFSVYRPLHILVLIPILYFSLLHSLFLGSIRYRVPLMPLVCIFAAIGLINLANWLSRAKPFQRASI